MLLAALGIALRLAYVLIWRRHDIAGGDAYYYHWQANEMTDGMWFINPYVLRGQGIVRATAGHPPLFSLILYPFSLLGIRSFLGHMIVTSCLGGITIWVMAEAARMMGGARAGLVAAAIAAVYPYQLINDSRVMSESLTATMVALILVVAYRFVLRPSYGRAALVGMVLAGGALTRAELSLYVPFVVGGVAMAAWRKFGFVRAFRWAGVSLLVAGCCVAPWVGWNMTRFTYPVFISNGFGSTLGNTNCDITYYGDLLGFWAQDCMSNPPPLGDESEWELYWRKRAFEYIGDHRERVPVVVAARIGRMFAVYRPIQGVRLDQYVEIREPPLSRTGLWMYGFMMPMCIAGAVLTRRRGLPVAPIVGAFLVVVSTAALAFGLTRYRATFDAVLVPTAAVAIARVGERVRRGVLLGVDV